MRLLIFLWRARYYATYQVLLCIQGHHKAWSINSHQLKSEKGYSSSTSNSVRELLYLPTVYTLDFLDIGLIAFIFTMFNGFMTGILFYFTFAYIFPQSVHLAMRGQRFKFDPTLLIGLCSFRFIIPVRELFIFPLINFLTSYISELVRRTSFSSLHTRKICT